MLTNEQLRDYADMKILMAEAKAMEKEMKAVVDAEFEARYMEDGTKTRDVLEDGEKLASLTWVPGQPAKEETVLLVDDPEAFHDWCGRHNCLVPNEEKALWILVQTGEVPDGCDVSTKYSGGKSGYVKATPTKPYKALFASKARKLLGGAE